MSSEHVYSLNYLFIFFKGDEFRVAFSKIRELGSIIPEHVGIIALTSTTTKDTDTPLVTNATAS